MGSIIEFPAKQQEPSGMEPPEGVILEFRAFALDGGVRVEGKISEWFEQHARSCQSCRTLLLRDLSEFLEKLRATLGATKQ